MGSRSKVFVPKGIDLKKILKVTENEEEYLKYFSEKKNNKKLFGINDKQLLDSYEVGVELYTQLEYESASMVFSFLIHVDPKVASFWYGLGLAEHNLNHYEVAIQAYSIAAGLNPENIDALLNLGICFNELGLTEQGIDFLNQAVKDFEESEDFEDKALLSEIKNKIAVLIKTWENSSKGDL